MVRRSRNIEVGYGCAGVIVRASLEAIAAESSGAKVGYSDAINEIDALRCFGVPNAAMSLHGFTPLSASRSDPSRTLGKEGV